MKNAKVIFHFYRGLIRIGDNQSFGSIGDNLYQAFVNMTRWVYAHTRFSVVFHWYNTISFHQLLDDQTLTEEVKGGHPNEL
jgi:hypothetical protein